MSELVTYKHCQWSNLGPIKMKTFVKQKYNKVGGGIWDPFAIPLIISLAALVLHQNFYLGQQSRNILQKEFFHVLVIDIVATLPYKAKVQVLHCMIHVEKKRTGNFLRKLSDFPMSHTSRGSLSCALSDFCSFFPCDFLSLEKQFIQILTTQHNLNTFLEAKKPRKGKA